MKGANRRGVTSPPSSIPHAESGPHLDSIQCQTKRKPGGASAGAGVCRGLALHAC